MNPLYQSLFIIIFYYFLTWEKLNVLTVCYHPTKIIAFGPETGRSLTCNVGPILIGKRNVLNWSPFPIVVSVDCRTGSVCSLGPYLMQQLFLKVEIGILLPFLS